MDKFLKNDTSKSHLNFIKFKHEENANEPDDVDYSWFYIPFISAILILIVVQVIYCIYLFLNKEKIDHGCYGTKCTKTKTKDVMLNLPVLTNQLDKLCECINKGAKRKQENFNFDEGSQTSRTNLLPKTLSFEKLDQRTESLFKSSSVQRQASISKILPSFYQYSEKLIRSEPQQKSYHNEIGNNASENDYNKTKKINSHSSTQEMFYAPKDAIITTAEKSTNTISPFNAFAGNKRSIMTETPKQWAITEAIWNQENIYKRGRLSLSSDFIPIQKPETYYNSKALSSLANKIPNNKFTSMPESDSSRAYLKAAQKTNYKAEILKRWAIPEKQFEKMWDNYEYEKPNYEIKRKLKEFERYGPYFQKPQKRNSETETPKEWAIADSMQKHWNAYINPENFDKKDNNFRNQSEEAKPSSRAFLEGPQKRKKKYSFPNHWQIKQPILKQVDIHKNKKRRFYPNESDYDSENESEIMKNKGKYMFVSENVQRRTNGSKTRLTITNPADKKQKQLKEHIPPYSSDDLQDNNYYYIPKLENYQGRNAYVPYYGGETGRAFRDNPSTKWSYIESTQGQEKIFGVVNPYSNDEFPKQKKNYEKSDSVLSTEEVILSINHNKANQRLIRKTNQPPKSAIYKDNSFNESLIYLSPPNLKQIPESRIIMTSGKNENESKDSEESFKKDSPQFNAQKIEVKETSIVEKIVSVINPLNYFKSPKPAKQEQELLTDPIISNDHPKIEESAPDIEKEDSYDSCGDEQQTCPLACPLTCPMTYPEMENEKEAMLESNVPNLKKGKMKCKKCNKTKRSICVEPHYYPTPENSEGYANVYAPPYYQYPYLPAPYGCFPMTEYQ